MHTASDLTIRETATLSGVSEATIKKAVDARVLRTVTAPSRFRGGATRYLPLKAVAYFRSLKEANLADLPLRHKRAIWAKLARLEPPRLEAIEFAPGALIDVKRLAADSLRDAEQYRDARDRYIKSDPEILGGTPVISGTRLTVYSIHGRLRGGDSIDDLALDYPHVPRDAFAAAAICAKAHPLRPHRSGKPWRKQAEQL